MYRRPIDIRAGNIIEQLIEDAEGFVVKSEQFGIEQILRENDALRSIPQNKSAPMRLGARIPKLVWERWMKETGGAIMRDQKLLKRKLNSPEFKRLKTIEGTL